VGRDFLDGQLDILERTLEQTDAEDLEDMSSTVVPLAEALLNIGETSGSKEKVLRAHAVLAETASMGIWALDSLDEHTKDTTS
jgi:hypothetical protein